MDDAVTTDEIIKRFNRNLESAIASCGFRNVIEVLEHAPGIVSVMNSNLDMLIIYSSRRHANNGNLEAQRYLVNDFCKKSEIGTMPFFIKGRLNLRDFLREEFKSADDSCWHDGPKRISLEETELNAA